MSGGMTNATSLGDLLGPLADVLDAPETVEISCNPDGRVFVERFGAPASCWGTLEPGRTSRFVRWCATWSETAVTGDRPILSGRIPGTAHRIEALLPPVTDGPCFSIRRHRDTVPCLEECVPENVPRGILMDAIAARKNVLIAGATGAGKTTLLNACLGEMERIAPETRLLVIEDTPEIRSPFRNSVALRTSDGVTMDRLLVSALRQAPDRIVVGEVREGSVLLTLVKAWNTGHPGGLVTLHANSADEVIDRLSLLATEVMACDPVPVLMQATDLIVFIHRDTGRPVLSSIRAAVRDPDGATRLEDLHDHSS